jgi:hypothetical protein
MKKKTLIITIISIIAVAALGITAYSAATYGTTADPLVTLSYITDKLTPDIMAAFDSKLSDAAANLESEISAGGGVFTTYKLVSVYAGQTLTAAPGCEVLLREGSVSVSNGSSLADTTGGNTLYSGEELSASHLCIAAGTAYVTASSYSTLLVRGGYTIS